MTRPVLAAIALSFLLLALPFCLLLCGSEVAEYPEEHRQVLSYLANPFSGDSLNFLPAAERAHMQDVKALFMIGGFLTMLSLGYLLAASYWMYREKQERIIPKVLRWTGWVLLGLCFLLGLLSLIGFDGFWTFFHTIFFPQGNWQFPTESILIQMYPLEFFQTFVAKWLLFVLILGALSIAFSLFTQRMLDHERMFNARRKG